MAGWSSRSVAKVICALVDARARRAGTACNLLAPFAVIVLASCASRASRASKAEAACNESRYAAARANALGVTTVSVVVSNVRPNKGDLRLGLYDATTPFPKEAGHLAEVVMPTTEAKIVLASFDGVPPGRYAIAVFQDENADGRLGFSIFGFPNEPLTFSRDAPMKAFGPPSFDDASFDVGMKPVTLTVHLPG